ncbi:MAG: dihydrodipicolinate reductase C-terminal domain-containing protein [Balneolaceae bacterium]
MKISVIGTGKTGGEVVKLLGSQLLYAFDEDRPPVREKLKESDAVIIFVPGESAGEIIDMVLNSGVPAVWGTTGYNWPEDLGERIKVAGTRWILASNFSLGMSLVRRCLNVIGQGSRVLQDPEFHIHEVHHIHKKDAPSGTAISWKKWLGREEAAISSAREGDVKGIHSLHVKTEFESIHLKHEAHERAVFAEGAIWAARYLQTHQDLMPGLYSFESIVDQAFQENV